MTRGARAGRAPLFLAALAFVPLHAAQPRPQVAAAGATFSVVQQGRRIGTVTSSVMPEEDGWVIQGSSYLGGSYALTVRRFEAHYDAEWRARFATMELATPAESLIAHTAINGGRTRTEIVHGGRVELGEHQVSTDTLVLPDLVFSAYEALAERLGRTAPGTTLPAFVLPLSEVPLRVDAAAPEQLQTATGPLTTLRWSVSFVTPNKEHPAQVWVADGRLVRVDMPVEQISVIRSDLVLIPLPTAR